MIAAPQERALLRPALRSPRLANIGGNGQSTSDYKTCVDAVTGKK